ncbi:M56 family metallopeptidase [Lutibacter flavus]|uniref:Signal transducer regulating beta-lactamase production, contains metallopeptidase domain n=1 Tax=Lutibacter flavus TaxID=691689 RepID=A0A238ZLE0_9FLAO|nr:M56 family metallopeptidase [Lutibacter flavus]SNR84215.1 Signal transducer regulating beta-lactamase production, contains metallopeptidase domain [Lutibacter flavus]
MDYFLKASGLVIILFLFYYIFLKNETFFKSIRWYFLIGLILVLSIPLIEIPIYVEQSINQLNTFNYSDLQITNVEVQENSINWIQIATYLYLFGFLFFCVKFLIQLFSLGYLLSKHQFIKQGNYYFVETSNNISPFSFFNVIIYNKSQFTIDELEQIINHEKAHVLQWHSVDTILAHLLVITLWFNPFVWLYKKAVQQNLEFLADEHALELANNQQLYQLTLLKTCKLNYCTEITNNFYNSLIKKRIIMLQKNRSTNKNQWKYALLLPILVAFILSFNTKIIAQEKKLVEIEEISNLKVDLLIDKTSIDEHLKEETSFFKNEFDISITFKGIKRNSDNEITAIKIDAKGENLRSKFSNSGSKPINPIKISYDSDTNSITIGNVSEIHDKHFSYKIHKSGDAKPKGKPNKNSNHIFISSDGKEKTWTIKDVEIDQDSDKSESIIYLTTIDNDSIISEKITLKGNGKNVWIHKNNESKKLKLIEEISDSLNLNREYNVKVNNLEYHFDDDTTIEIKNDDNSENVFIVKTDGNSINKHKIKNDNFVFITTPNEKPKYYLNGKEISQEEMEAINPDSIESVNVFKGEKAVEKYGKKAENGVVKITLKDHVNSKNSKPLFIVDDKEMNSKEAKEINPDNIKTMNVIKGNKAIEKYGKKAENGVIEITTKKE